MGDGDGGGIVLDNFDALDNGVVAFCSSSFQSVFKHFCCWVLAQDGVFQLRDRDRIRWTAMAQGGDSFALAASPP